MQPDLFSVSKLFTENLYRIPDYQRGYAWRDRQLKDFWSDIEQLESGRNHYIGVLTLEEVPPTDLQRWDDDRWIIDSKHFLPYYVVDGQQRLTTIIIFLQCLVEKLKPLDQVNYTSAQEIRKKFIFESRDGGISRSYVFGYERDNPSYEFLKTVVFQERSDNHAPPEETIYTHNLRAAKEYFSEKLNDVGLADLETLYTKVTQHLLFNVYAISREIDVFVAFETMNNRGKLLSNLELLKNRLIYLSTKLDTPADEKSKLRKLINESWKTLYHYLGKNRDRPLDDDIFLSTHHWLYFRPSLAKGEDGDTSARRWFFRDQEYKDALLDNIFTAKNLRKTEGEKTPGTLSLSNFYEYSHDIKETVRKYYEIYNPEDCDFSDDERIFLERLRRIGDDEDMILVLALFRAKAENPDGRLRILALLEKILFIDTITPYIPGIEKPKHSDIGARLAAGVITVTDVEKELVAYLDELMNKADLSKAIQQWSKSRGGYGWKGVRYFLYEYEQKLKGSSKTNREKLVWAEFTREKFDEDYHTVEHIFPQKITDESWRKTFERFSTKEKNVLRHSLGNLVPLSRGKNSSLGNLSFEDKKRNSDDTVGYTFGCYSENEIAGLEEWNAREILLRGVKLLRFMEERWNIPLGNDFNKVTSLGLGFVFKVYPDLREELRPDTQAC